MQWSKAIALLGAGAGAREDMLPVHGSLCRVKTSQLLWHGLTSFYSQFLIKISKAIQLLLLHTVFGNVAFFMHTWRQDDVPKVSQELLAPVNNGNSFDVSAWPSIVIIVGELPVGFSDALAKSKLT